MAHHHLIVHPLVLRRVQVERVHDVTPRMRRVTLTGEQLAAFETDGLELPAFATPAFDDHVKLLFASDGDVASVLPTQLAHGIEWAPSETRQGRDYTPRRYDPETRELDLDFVLHGDGPAASWAQRARAGDELWFAGPKASTVVPADADWALLVGDETALPAIGRYFEERPLDAPVRAVIAIADPAAKQELALREGDTVEWVLVGHDDGEALAEAVRRVEPLTGTPFVWGAAESRALLAVRRYAREIGAAKTRTNITGYWHRRGDEEAAVGTADAPAALPPSPVEWFALRTALRSGLLDAVSSGPEPLQALAQRLAVADDRLRVLVDALVSGSILARAENGDVGLGPLGEELIEDEHARERYDGFEAEQVLALEALGASLAGGASAWERQHSRSLLGSAVADVSLYEELIEEAEGISYVLSGLADDPVWTASDSIGITGPGALAVGAALAPTAAGRLVIVEETDPLSALREAAGSEHSFSFSETWEGCGLVVTALALNHRSDAEAIDLLAGLREAAPVAVLIEQLTPDGLSPAADAQHALVRLAATGASASTPERVVRLVEAVGWRVRARRKLGWGVECVELAAAIREP